MTVTLWARTSYEVTVANVKPSISLTGPATADEGETKTYSFTVSDPGHGHAHAGHGLWQQRRQGGRLGRL